MSHTLKDLQNFGFVFLAYISVYQKLLKSCVTKILATQESVGLCGGNITIWGRSLKKFQTKTFELEDLWKLWLGRKTSPYTPVITS